MLKSGQTWKGVFATLDATGALSAATVGPAGALYVDGVLNGAGVTIAGANPYSFSVTLPAMTAGQSASIYIAATVGGVATAGVIAFDQADTKLASDLNDLAQADILSDATPFAGGNVDAAISTRGTANAGDAMALTVGERTTLAGVVWTYATRTLTSISAFLASIAAAVWTYATRTLTSSSTAPGVGLTAQAWTVLRGDTLTRTFSTIAADPTITRCRLTVKRRYEDTDNEAILAVDSTSGLLRLNGATPGTYTATFTVATGVLSVPAATMAQLDPRGYRYDVQVWRGAVVQTIERGGFVLTEDYTMAV